MIKPCDKGAGLIITNFDDYTESVENHLNSKAENSDIFKTTYKSGNQKPK